VTSDTLADQCFIARLDLIRQRYPSRPAIVVDGEVSLTYLQLWQYAVRIAEAMEPFVNKAESIVGLHLPKSADYVASMIATWMANAAWLPLDPTTPDLQRQHMIDDCNLSLIVSDRCQKAGACPVMQVDQLPEQTESATSGPSHAMRYESLEQLAYVIYTSGTTGKPRGVAVEHRGIVNLIDNQIQAFGLNYESRCLLYYPLCFDASLSDISTALLSGAALCIESGLGPDTSSRVMELIQKRGITHADLPPSLLNVLSISDVPACLQTIIIGGQACDPKTVRQWVRKVRLVNVYGPTETTVCSSLCICDANWNRTLIGQPLSGIEYRVVDANFVAIEPGQLGELLIGGVGVARGYLNQPEQTASRFVLLDDRVFYRSGDEVRLDLDGEFVFIGRIDRQINHNGFRIEPEEIEILASSIPGVSSAAVLLRKVHDLSPRPSLLLFVETENSELTEAEIRTGIAEHLPANKVRPLVRILSALPRLPSGKCDFAELARIRLQAASDTSLEHLSAEQQVILGILRDVLATDDFAPDDDFFAFGGDSLDAIQVSALAVAHGISIPGWMVNFGRTVREISQLMTRGSLTSGGYRCSTIWLREDVESLKESTVQATVPPPKDRRSTVLLTGATGFLGCRILERLLADGHCDVVCHVRGDNADAATRRLWDHLANQKIFVDESQRRRVRVVVGDLACPQLGIKPADFTELSKHVGRVIHCAAGVDSLSTYHELRPSNVIGLLEILNFVVQCGGIRLDYMSTLSVFAGTDSCCGCHLETDSLPETKWVYGGYAQSKWAAEVLLHQFLLQYPSMAQQIAVYRLGLLTADTRTGLTPSRDVLTMTVRGFCKRNCVPDPLPDICFDMTPVDFAARAIMAIGGSAAAIQSRNTWHIAGHRLVSASSLFEFIRSCGVTLTRVPHSKFLQQAQRSSIDPEESMAFLSLTRWLPGFDADRFRATDLFQATDCSFDTGCTQQVLDEFNLRCPLPNDELLQLSLKPIIQETYQKRGWQLDEMAN